MTKKILHTIFSLAMVYQATFAQPTDNPYRSKYGEAPKWTNELKWDRVFSIQNYTDSAGYWDAALSTAMQEVSAGGGGVIYFPTGEYKFMRDVVLLDHVVLRGATPAPENSTAIQDNFAPPTRLVFPKYEPLLSGEGTPVSTAFKSITATGKQNVGLVYFDINRGRIWAGSGTVRSQNVLVFGIRQNNIAIPQPDIPSGYLDYMQPWQRFSYRFCYNISLGVLKNGAIINCRVNDLDSNSVHPIEDDSYDQPGYVLKGRFNPNDETPTGRVATQTINGVTLDTTHVRHGERARFDYLNHYGIRVVGAYYNPATLDTVIDQQLEISHNWVRTTMRVSIFGEGIGLKMNGNVKRDTPGKRVFIDPTGRNVSNGAHQTFENRGINFAGENIEIKNNDIQVYRHRYMYSHYSTTDGEGIMIQYQDTWGTRMYDVNISDNKVNAWIGFYDIQADVRNVTIANNDLLNMGNVLLFKKEDFHRMDNIHVTNNKNITGISFGLKKLSDGTLYTVKGNNLSVTGNTGSGNITYPCQAVVSNNSTFVDKMACSPDMIYFTHTPYFGELNVSKDRVISISFQPDIKAGTNNTVYLIKNDTDTLPGVSFSIAQKTLTLSHPELNSANTVYKVIIPENTVQSTSGSLPNEKVEWWFKTTPMPYIRTTFPSAGISAVYLNTAISAEFMYEVSVVDLSGVSITDEEDNAVNNVMASLAGDGRLITFSSEALEANRTYTVTIPAGAVTNDAGYLNDEFKWSFATSLITSHVQALPLSNLTVKVFPNPVGQQSLNLEASGALINEWTISDLNGKTLLSGTCQACPGETLNVSTLHPGIYLLKINKTTVYKIVKQ